MDYEPLYKMESHGGDGWFGIDIQVAAKNLPDLKEEQSQGIRIASSKAVKLIESAIRGEIKSRDPETATEKENNRKLISQVFDTPIFVEEIPNGYCGDWCCAHLPWFIVTTKVGRFTIGWRKRVVSIDWNETVNTETSDVIFKDENVTKGYKSIHAWSIEDARQYVAMIMLSTVV